MRWFIILAVTIAIGVGGAAAVDANQPAALTMAPDGRIALSLSGAPFAQIAAVAADPQWRFAQPKPASWEPSGDERRFSLSLGGVDLTGVTSLTAATDPHAAEVRFTYQSPAAIELACLGASIELPAAIAAGGTWQADGQRGTFPAAFGEVHLYNGSVRSLTAAAADGRQLVVTFPAATQVLVQDNRRWGPTFSLRLGPQGHRLAAATASTIAFSLSTTGVLERRRSEPVVLTAGADWVPLTTEIEVEPGSALDLSGQGFVKAPCGIDGRVIADREGRFAFERDPTPRRFYGVNLCFDAQYLAHDQADRLTERLVRLGYDSVRIHHYEVGLTGWGKAGFAWDTEKLDRLDYLFAACRKRGLYLTTDLYVSRPVRSAQVGMPGDEDWTYRYKVLVPVHEPAMQDLLTWCRTFFDRVNPHTGVRLADDPTIAWLSLINEGNVANYWSDVRKISQWQVAWNRWLVERYHDRARLALRYGDELKADEDPIAGSVTLPEQPLGDTLRQRDIAVFLADTEQAMARRITGFLRDELKCRALITNLNAWTNPATYQRVRQDFDYVDDHFYVDHPTFVDRDWQLPSRCGNANPLREGAWGGRASAALRLWGKPFTITEYNYAAPGRFRGVGGILTGALAALQGWNGIWRFAYAHGEGSLFQPSPIGYFDLASDPLNQAADRAAVMLFRRGDLATSTHRAVLTLDPAQLREPTTRVPEMNSAPHWLAWLGAIGSEVRAPGSTSAGVLSDGAMPITFGESDDQVLAKLRPHGWLAEGNPTDPRASVFRTGDGALLIDARRGQLAFDTPRTAGGYAESGDTIDAPKAGVRVDGLSQGATVFVTSLDGQPIRRAKRLLITHLTDLQNTGTTYAEPERQLLLKWGGLPHLVRDGTATVHLRIDRPEACTIHGLSTGGRRIGTIATRVVDGELVVPCAVRAADGARMLYEVVR